MARDPNVLLKGLRCLLLKEGNHDIGRVRATLIAIWLKYKLDTPIEIKACFFDIQLETLINELLRIK